MKIKEKNSDTLHLLLVGVLVLLVAVGSILLLDKDQVNNTEVEFLEARAKADYELLNDNFEVAEKAYIQISKEYPNFDSLTNRLAMVNEKRELYNSYTSLQEELNTHIEAIENLESYMVIIERRNTNLNRANTNKTVNEDEGDLEASSIKVEDAKVPKTSIKDILDIVNFDGTEIKYIGETEGGKANGYGYAVFSKKGFYEGHWTNNRRNGKGIYYWQNGDTYEGNYVAGFRDGFGVYTFASGEVYNGLWENNLRHGEGVLTNKKGKLVFEGEWEEDEPLSHSKDKRKGR